MLNGSYDSKFFVKTIHAYFFSHNFLVNVYHYLIGEISVRTASEGSELHNE